MAAPSYKTTPIRLATMADFTGGWNLRGNAFQLGGNESNDLLDMDIQIGGGFIQRQVVQPWGGTGLAGVVSSLSPFQTTTFQQVVAQSGTTLQWSSGSAWHNITGMGVTTTAKMRSAVFGNMLYLQNGTDGPIRWNGSGGVQLFSAYNNNIGSEVAAPLLDRNMPIAKLICVHMGRVFVANTSETSQSFPNRIRWSHPGFAEDWRAQDFIDIDVGHDGDVITAIVSYHGRLLIFKNQSMYELVGYGPENWQVVPMTTDIGCVSQEAVCISDVGLFFFSWPQGVYLDKGTGPYPIFDKIWPLIRDSRIPAQFQSNITLEWINRLLYCAVPMDGSTTNNRVLVYNPWIWKHRYMRFLEGPWYPFSIPAGQMLEMNQPGSNIIHLASHSSVATVGQLEQSGAADQWFGQPATPIPAYYTTRWYDVGSPAVIKRWRHPDIVMRGGMTAPLQVDIKRDYDASRTYKTFFLAGQAAPTSALTWTQQLTRPVITTVTNGGTPGNTLYSYVVTATSGTGETGGDSSGTAGGTNTGSSTLSASSFNTVSWVGVLGATGYNIYRADLRLGGLVYRYIASVDSNTSSYQDIGVTATSTTLPPNNTAFGFGLNTLWDDGSGTVGEVWAGQPQLSELIVRGSSMGSARAVQMIFTGPSGIQWGIDAITAKYINKRIRG